MDNMDAPTKNEMKINENSTASGTQDPVLIGYIHNLSPLKTSQRTSNTYFDMNIQTQDKLYRAVCFSAEKHKDFKSRFESSSPIKLNKFQLKRNARTTEDEIHLTKRTKIEDAKEEETNFDLAEKDTTDTQSLAPTSLHDINTKKQSGKVNVLGRITLTGQEETIMTRGKTLKKQEAVITDNTASMRIVLWEDDILKIKSGCSYLLSHVIIKTYQDKKYIALNKQSLVRASEELIDRIDDTSVENLLQTVNCPAEAIKSVLKFMSCSNCKMKVVPIPGKKLTRCTECGFTQLTSRCTTKMYANAVFHTNDNKELVLVLFEDKIEQLYKLFSTQEEEINDFEKYDDDDIMMMLLTVQATIVYNNNKNVVAIKEL